MICTSCHQLIEDCKCIGIDEQLKIACDSEYVMFKWCRTCDKHYRRCRCERPDFYVRSGGKELPIPEDGFTSIDGQRVVPDLKAR